VIVVAIDDKTIRQEGALSLPRATQAHIARQLNAAGASVIVWDLVFDNKPEQAEGNAEFREVLSQLPAPVLGESYERAPEQDDNEILDVEPAQPQIDDLFLNAENATVAHVNVSADPSDGVVRSLPLVYERDRRFVFSLSLQALASLRGTEPTIRADGGINVGNQRIPTEGRNSLRLNFTGRLDNDGKDNVVSAADVITGAANPARFRDAVVFIGVTATLARDTLLAPLDKSSTYPGVLIHANALNTMLTSGFLEPVSDAENTLVVGLLTLMVALSVLFVPVWASAVFVLLLTGLPPLFPGAFLLIAFQRFDNGDIMNIVYSLGAIVAAFVGGLAVKYLTETRQRRRVSSLFAQYVPEEVARQLEESGALESHIDGERVDVGLFFCDLRGFTSLSATLEPHDVRAMLNHFYDLLTEIIHNHGGTVLKFVGDEVFAVFGAPLPCLNNAQATLDCAMEIQGRAHELDDMLANLHIPPVKFGIGMNAGDVVAAHIGGGRRRQYDIVGDTVNLGSRLCSQAGKGEIVLPEKMIERLTNVPPMESMGAVQLKGLDEPVPLFKVVVGDSEPRQPTPAGTSAPS
jgi:class 3 adenylate cyclase